LWTGNILYNFNFRTVLKLKVSFLEPNSGGKEQRNRSFNGREKERNTLAHTHTHNPQYNKSQKKWDLHKNDNVNKGEKIDGLNGVNGNINTSFVFLNSTRVPAQAMEIYRESGDRVTQFLTCTMDGGEWSASRPGRFTPEEIAPSIQTIDS
jgi:hypothetical protein